MEQHIPQEEIRRIIINDMVKKRGSIVPVIGERLYLLEGFDKSIIFMDVNNYFHADYYN